MEGDEDMDDVAAMLPDDDMPSSPDRDEPEESDAAERMERLAIAGALMDAIESKDREAVAAVLALLVGD
jgi:hypothetical protein